MLRRLAVFALLATTSCSSFPGTYRRTLEYDGYVLRPLAPARPKANDCDFTIVTKVPTEGAEEIATLLPKSEAKYNLPGVEKFHADVREQVCSAGGDIVAVEVKDRGEVVQGIVFRRP